MIIKGLDSLFRNQKYHDTEFIRESIYTAIVNHRETAEAELGQELIQKLEHVLNHFLYESPSSFNKLKAEYGEAMDILNFEKDLFAIKNR